jgi:alpha-L-fucosidase
MKTIFTILAALLPLLSTAAPEPRTAWFEDARFGMFIHFGLYSIPAGVWDGKRMARNDYAEWIRFQHNWPEPGGIPKERYDMLLEQFAPKSFDADLWIREAKNAGMKYFLITAKHHDGFALWESRVSGYNVVKATPFKRDILAELTAACRRHGLKVGFYYSHWLDWEHPGGALPPWPEMKGDPPLKQPSQEAFDSYWTGKCLPQVKELLVNFEPDFLWFDSWGKCSAQFLTPERLDRLITLVRETRPACLINSRIGTKEGVDYLSTGDNSFPKQGFKQAWETSGTLNHSWGYHRLDFKWKATSDLLRNLINNASRGGNYQLNVGPTGEGVFQPAAIRRLREIGAWMAVHGDSIQGTRPAPYPEPAWGRLTVRPLPGGGTRVYAFVFDPKPGSVLTIDGPVAPAVGELVETSQSVAISPVEGGFSFTLPETLPDPNLAVFVFDCGPLAALRPSHSF